MTLADPLQPSEMMRAGLMADTIDETFESLDEPSIETEAEEEVNKAGCTACRSVPATSVGSVRLSSPPPAAGAGRGCGGHPQQGRGPEPAAAGRGGGTGSGGRRTAPEARGPQAVERHVLHMFQPSTHAMGDPHDVHRYLSRKKILSLKKHPCLAKHSLLNYLSMLLYLARAL